MKNSIWKYPLVICGIQSVPMPEGAEILTVQMQAGSLCLWALVDPEPELPKQNREIEILGTGHHFTQTNCRRYIGTAQMGPLVWHVFELTS